MLSRVAATAPAVRHAVFVAAALVAQQVAGKATRDALFLSHFDVRELPLASAATALVSLGAIFVFARAMSAFSPARLMPVALCAGSALLVAEWVLSRWLPRAAALAVYLHMGLFGAPLISGFWSLVNERFDPHMAKRAMGPIGTGAALGGVVGGVATWQLASVVSLPTMLLAMAALGLLCLPSMIELRPPSSAEANGITTGADGRSSSGLRLILSLSHLRRLALLVGLVALLEGILDYLFNSAAVASFAKGRALVSFFALFHAGVGVIALGVQALLTRPMLEKLGLGATLAVQPAAVAVGGILALAVPRLWTVVLVRGTHAVLRNSLFRSGYELLYAPLLREQKRPTKAILDVGFDRLGTIAGSGAVLGVLALAPASPTRPLLALAVLTAAAIATLAAPLRRGYVAALAHSLRTGAVRLDEIEVADATTRQAMADIDQAPRAAEPPPGGDPLLEAIADLRSGEASRIRKVLLPKDDLDPELVAHVMPLLARDDVFGDVLRALRRATPHATGQLLDALLDPRQPPIVRRRLPRVLKVVPTQPVVDGLLAGLGDERADVRFRCAQALVRLREQDATLVMPRPLIVAAALRLIGGPAPDLDHAFLILALTLEREPLEMALRALRMGDEALRGTALEYLDNVLPEPVRQKLWPTLGGPVAPPRSGRSVEEVRDDLLRSTRSTSVRRSARRRDLKTRPATPS